MKPNEIAKNVLSDRTCETCVAKQGHVHPDDVCYRWLGEAVGWQWWPRDKNGTCEDWTDKER